MNGISTTNQMTKTKITTFTCKFQICVFSSCFKTSVVFIATRYGCNDYIDSDTNKTKQLNVHQRQEERQI